MNFRYEWRVLRNGLLIAPDSFGPCYSSEEFSSYNSEEDAYSDWARINEKFPFESEHEMVLIKIFTRPDN